MNAPLSRELFAMAPGLTYLNNAAIGVMPIAARDAIVKFANEHAARGVLGTVAYEVALAPARKRLGAFVGAQASEVAFLGNTSQAANLLARGFDWQSGDEIIINDNEFGSNALPWLSLRELGVVVRMIETNRERMTPDVLSRHLTSRTRLVATSWVSFTDGYRHDLAALAQIAHNANAVFVVDVIQGLGAFPLDMEQLGLDALFGGAQKWLLAQPGLGFLCVRRSLLSRLRLRMPGWRSVADMWNFLDYDQPLLPGADRFEAGTPNLLGIAALMASLDILDTVTADVRGTYILELTNYLVEGLQKRNALLTSIRSGGAASGIVTFSLPGVDPIETGKHLALAGVVVTARSNGVRVSPHAYSTYEDIDKLLASL